MRPNRIALYGAAAIAALAAGFAQHASADAGHGMFGHALPGPSRCLPTTRAAFAARGAVPAGMLAIPAGEFSMGSDDPRFSDARPWHRVRIAAFALARTEVTNAQFVRFVAATQYVTIAERRPAAKDVPGVPDADRVAGALVFTPPNRPVPLDDDAQWWRYVPGADWRHPAGPGSSLRGLDNAPVVQVAYDDALAYARWMHARLPTEAEYEYAERGGLTCKTYAWGDAEMPGGTMPANIYMGHFPDHSTNGTPGVKAVGSYPPNGYGLSDMAGNVWEWTGDWYRADYYATLAAHGVPTVDPHGPRDSDDPVEPGVAKRSVRGGSFVCTDQFCSRFEAGGRGEAEPHSASNHTGFRIAATVRSRG